MKILFDQGTPVPLRKFLVGHFVSTAYEESWNALSNGELLAVAEAAGFEILITTDQNLRYQQNMTERKINIVVLLTTSWPRIQTQVDVIAANINSLTTGDYLEISIP